LMNKKLFQNLRGNYRQQSEHSIANEPEQCIPRQQESKTSS
jgi:hypothetical protein